MRKVISWNVMTLDGYFEGETPWNLAFHETVWGPELEQLSMEQLGAAGALLFGRKTYEGMAAYWSKEVGGAEPRPIADAMNSIPKLVASRTLTSVDWNNARLVNGDAADAARALRQEDGKDVFVFGSAQLLGDLMRHDLVDEHRICIAPVTIGNGTPLFKPGVAARLDLLEARPTAAGGIIVRYAPRRG